MSLKKQNVFKHPCRYVKNTSGRITVFAPVLLAVRNPYGNRRSIPYARAWEGDLLKFNEKQDFECLVN